VRPIGIDLFAGAGGLSLGFERAGFDVRAAVEFDPIHCATHEYNFPECATICRDVATLSGQELRSLAGIPEEEIAVVFGGAPCQGFSMIGKRAIDDPRNSLVRHFVRLVNELQPQYFVFENVRGLTLGKQRRFLEEIIADFEACGYEVLTPYEVLSASAYGVPQDRQRLFLVGARAGQILPQYPKPCQHSVTVWEALADLPEADDFDELIREECVHAEFGEPSEYARKLRGIENDANDFGYKREFEPALLTASLRTGHTEKSRKRFAATEFGRTEPVSRFHKLDPHGFCNTLRAGTASDRGAFTSPRPIHPYSPRCITNREAARLHSYPDWFRFHVTKWHGFRQIGNSVPPFLAQAVSAQVMRAIGYRPRRPWRVMQLGDSALLNMSMGEACRYYRVPFDTIPQRDRKLARKDKEPVYG